MAGCDWLAWRRLALAVASGCGCTLALAVIAVVELWKVRVCWQSLGDACVLAELGRVRVCLQSLVR